MITKKRFSSVDGVTSRFLSDFIIQSEQFARVYVYFYNPAGVEGAIDPGTGLPTRVADFPDPAEDLVNLDKWDLVDNSILFYTEPVAGSSVYLEVATTPEEFGDTLTAPAVERALVAATEAEASAAAALVSETNAEASAQLVIDKVHTVDTIAEMLTLNVVEHTNVNVLGGTVINDGRGGIFNYDVTQVAVNNGGTIIDGWVRQYSGAINSKWFDTLDNFFAVNGSKIITETLNETITNVTNFMDSLANLTIESGYNVTITLPSGEHVIPTTTNITGKGLENLLVLGATNTKLALTGVSVISNGASDHSVTFTTATPIGASIGDYVVASYLSGTGNIQTLAGGWIVTGVSGNDVTVKNTCKAATIGAVTFTSGSLYLIPTVLKYEGKSGLVISNVNGGQWSNIIIAGDGLVAGDGVLVEQGGYVTLANDADLPLVVHGFKNHGIYIATMSGAMIPRAFSCANGQNGLYGLDGFDVVATASVFNGNGTYGIIATVGGSMACGGVLVCGNTIGMVCSRDSIISAGNFYAFDNTSRGIWVTEYGMITLGGFTVTLRDNPVHIYADVYGFFNSIGGTLTFGTDEGVNNTVMETNGKIGDDGVAYIDPDAVGANPTALKYPDGTIIGSTDNGSYIKYPNGELECRGKSALTTTATASANIFFGNVTAMVYPVAFVGSLPKILQDVEEVQFLIWNSGTIAEALTGFTTRLLGSGIISSGYVHYVAKGRWK